MAGTRLYPVDSLPSRVIGADNNYLYMKWTGGVDSNRELWRTANRITEPTKIKDFADYGMTSISTAWSPVKSGGPDILFVVASDGVNYFLFKSIDKGDNFGDNSPLYNDGDYVLAFGTSASPLECSGFCWDNYNNQILVGEYNVDPVNPVFKLYKSANNGDIWTTIAAWNEISTNARHIHSVQQDPYTGYIYIAFGDAGAIGEGGVVRWDGISALPSNQDISAYDVVWTGAKKCVVGDILFSENYLYCATDSDLSDPAEDGIWQLNKDFTNVTRVNSDNLSYSQALLYGLKTSSGNMIFIGFGSADDQIIIITSAGETSWDATNVFNANNVTGSASGFLEFNNEIYIAMNAPGKRAYLGTAVVKELGTFNGTQPEIISPVYWVAPTGTNANSAFYTWDAYGDRSGNPWATPTYALTGDRVSHGGRIIIADGVYPETNALFLDYDNFSGGANLTAASLQTVVESASEDKTKVILTQTSDGIGAATLYIYKEETPILFRHITVLSQRAATPILNVVAHDARKGAVTFWDSDLGSFALSIASSGVSASECLEMVRCRIIWPYTANFAAVRIANVHSSIKIQSSIIIGGREAFVDDAKATSVEIINCTIYGYGRYGYIIYDHPTSLLLKNNIFQGAAGSTNSMLGSAAVETDDEIDYNCYNQAVPGVDNLGGSHSLVSTDPKLVDPANGDFRLRADSPCRDKALVIAGITTDFERKPVPMGRAPDIGAYEFPVPSPMGLNLGLGGGGRMIPPRRRRR